MICINTPIESIVLGDTHIGWVAIIVILFVMMNISVYSGIFVVIHILVFYFLLLCVY